MTSLRQVLERYWQTDVPNRHEGNEKAECQADLLLKQVLSLKN